MKPYYQDKWIANYHSDCRAILPKLNDNSVDLLLTDPPYGIGFMGKDWDKALPDKRIWAECLRVLKPGAFAFVMSIPRQDCLSRMIISLEDAGFNVGFTPIYWAYASGFPKAQNIGKAVDKRLGAERIIKGVNPVGRPNQLPKSGIYEHGTRGKVAYFDEAASGEAKALDGSYGGFQPKPAVEVIIVAMKPLSEKTFVDQALKNRKGITWLDDCRVPYESEGDKEGARFGTQMDIRGGNLKAPRGIKAKDVLSSQSGRFPANLLVSDDVLNDGKVTGAGITGSGRSIRHNSGGNTFWGRNKKPLMGDMFHLDSGSFSRYFDLDKWAQKTFPFLIVPKASKSEKNRGMSELSEKDDLTHEYRIERFNTKRKNIHPTVKPLKLMSYLITLGSRVGDVVLDPFMGSGTTPLAAKLLNRKCIGIEIEEKYCEIAAKRCSQRVFDLNV